jgi:hypothetical protein
MAGSGKLTEFKKLTLESLQVGEEFVSDDHLVLHEASTRTGSPWKTIIPGSPRAWRRLP